MVDKQRQGHDNLAWGQQTEQMAADYFLKEGYMIRERNWKLNNLEIDLILEKDRTLIFVEVKARKKGNQDPVDAVDRKKRARIINAADVYLRMQQHLYQYRFDIVTFTGDQNGCTMQHYPDAFLPPVNNGRRS